MKLLLLVFVSPLVASHSLGHHGGLARFHWEDSPLQEELSRPALHGGLAGYRSLQEELSRPSLLTAGYVGEARDAGSTHNHEASLLLAGFLPSIFHARPDPNQGCGPNPLIQLVREMPFWLEQSLRLGASGSSSQQDMMRYVRSDNAAFQEFLLFKRKLRRFEDCVKTGDGVRAKKIDDWSWTVKDSKVKNKGQGGQQNRQEWSQHDQDSSQPWQTSYVENNMDTLN